jgi:tRNA(fMet)-specific endonuclease VapC
MPALPFDADAAMTCARIRAALGRKGQMIGQLDCLIAAQAVAHELVPVTEKLRGFRRMPDLRCENWMRRPVAAAWPRRAIPFPSPLHSR